MSVLREILTDRFERVLVGCDFSFGYPAGLADVIADNPDASWRDVWSWVGAHILDEPNNRNNRFDVAAELNDRCDRSVYVRPFGVREPPPQLGCLGIVQIRMRPSMSFVSVSIA